MSDDDIEDAMMRSVKSATQEINPHLDLNLAMDEPQDRFYASAQITTPVYPQEHFFLTDKHDPIMPKKKRNKMTKTNYGKPPVAPIKRPATVEDDIEVDVDIELPLGKDPKSHDKDKNPELEEENVLGNYRPSSGDSRRSRRISVGKHSRLGTAEALTKRSSEKPKVDEDGELDKELEDPILNKFTGNATSKEEDKEFEESILVNKKIEEDKVNSKVTQKVSNVEESVKKTEVHKEIKEKERMEYISNKPAYKSLFTIKTVEDNKIFKQPEVNKEVLSEITSDTIELKKLNASLMKDKADLQDKELRYMQEIILIEQKYTETTKALKKELENTKAELQRVLKELENEKQLNKGSKDEYDTKMMIRMKEKEREISELKKAHLIEIEALKYEHKQSIKVKLKEFEEESERIRAQLQRKYEFERTAKKLGEINEELKAKLQSDYNKKEAELDAKITELERCKQEYKLTQEKLLEEQRQLQNTNQKLNNMQEVFSKENDNQKQVFEYKKKLLEEQHEKMLVEESMRRTRLMDEQRRFELDKAQYERDKAEWNSIREQQRVEIALEVKELAQKREEFEEALKDHNNNINNKLLGLETQRKQLAKDETDLLRREQLCIERELMLKRQYDELNLVAERIEYEKRAIEDEKADMTDIANQVNIRSLEIKEANVNLNKKLGDWNNTKEEIGMTQENLLEYKRKMEQDKKTVVDKCKELELLRYQFLKKKTVDETVQKLSKEYPLKTNTRPIVKSFNNTSGHFDSSIFIKNLEKEVSFILDCNSTQTEQDS